MKFKTFKEFDDFMSGLFGSVYINSFLYQKRLLYLMMINDNVYLEFARR